MGLMSKKRTGVLRMALNMALCRNCADLTSTWNRAKFLMKPKTIVAAVKPADTSSTIFSFRVITQYKQCRSKWQHVLQVTSVNTQVEIQIQLCRDVQSVLDDGAVGSQLVLLLSPDQSKCYTKEWKLVTQKQKPGRNIPILGKFIFTSEPATSPAWCMQPRR